MADVYIHGCMSLFPNRDHLRKSDRHQISESCHSTHRGCFSVLREYIIPPSSVPLRKHLLWDQVHTRLRPLAQPKTSPSF